MLTHTQLQFLVLLRAGLWAKPVNIDELLDPEKYQSTENKNKPQNKRNNKKNTESSNNSQGIVIDWPAIYRISREQTVVGLIADAIGTLPAEMMPPKAIAQRFAIDKLSIERSHQQLNTALNTIVQFLNAQGIPHVLLKGQGVAQNYPNPTSRTCGDIDLYVGKQYYKQACNLIIKDFQGRLIAECTHNMEISLKGITIEIHHIADMMVNPRKDKQFQEWTKRQLDANFTTTSIPAEENRTTPFNTWNNNGVQINRPPVLFDAVFIMTHMLRHMFYEGVGLRQLCDWTMHLHHNHETINAQQLQTILNELDLTKAWTVFATTAYSILGLPSEEIPLNQIESSKDHSERVLKVMFETGNFGHYNKKATQSTNSNYIIHKWKRFKYHFSYNLKIWPIFPKLMLIFTATWFKKGIKTVIHTT